MSVLAKRLAGLRQQAGAAVPPTATPVAPVASPRGKTTDGSVAPPAVPRGTTTRERMMPPDALRGGTTGERMAPINALRGNAIGERVAPPAALRGQTTGEQVSLPAALRGKTAGEQVAQLRKLLGLRPRALAPVRSFDRSLEGDEIAPGLRYVEKWVPFERLPDRLDLSALNLTAFDHDDIETHRILAFDTETTGLAGGTGTRAFMIGAGDWRDGGLRIRQLLMTTMGAEQAMLQEFTRWLEPHTVLLSYNGKCYDRPLLSTRYTLARLSDPVLGRDHIDLLHPVRRRYRGVWENCRLATIERQLLGVVREDDLPGSEAPAAWLDYLRGGSADKLRRVGDHNAQDLRSLAGLLVHFHAQAQLLPRQA